MTPTLPHSSLITHHSSLSSSLHLLDLRRRIRARQFTDELIQSAGALALILLFAIGAFGATLIILAAFVP